MSDLGSGTTPDAVRGSTGHCPRTLAAEGTSPTQATLPSGHETATQSAPESGHRLPQCTRSRVRRWMLLALLPNSPQRSEVELHMVAGKARTKTSARRRDQHRGAGLHTGTKRPMEATAEALTAEEW